MTWRAPSCRGITGITLLASYDVASTICPARRVGHAE